jgi:hypothetical protein
MKMKKEYYLKKVNKLSFLSYLVDIIDYSKSNSIFRIKYELKYLFVGFLLTASVSSLFIYVIIYLLENIEDLSNYTKSNKRVNQ